MENEILNIITKMAYSDQIIEAREKRLDDTPFPLKIELPPNVRVITDFNDEYYLKYENTLIINAIVYALKNNEEEYLKFVYNHINDLRNVLNNELNARIHTTKYAITNIAKSLKQINGKLTFNNEINLEAIKDNKNIFDKINKLFTETQIITNLYRKVLFEFLEAYDRDDMPYYLSIFLTTNRMDSLFLNNNDYIDKEELQSFKYIIIRMILQDNYITIKTELHENEISDYIDSLNNKSFEEELEEDEEAEIDYYNNLKETLYHIENCLQTGNFCLPQSQEMIENMLNTFIEFNYVKCKEYEKDLIDKDKQMRLELSKINPLYKFDINSL